jgi:hypothetical protein
MNKQIAEILNQPAFDRLKDWHDIGPVQKATLELFAELIVAECADVCENLQKWPSTEPRHCANDIRIHFGVEE